MQYEVESVDLSVEIVGDTTISAQIEPAVPIETVIDDSARIEVEEAINYIKSGEAEIAAATSIGVGQIAATVISKTAEFDTHVADKIALAQNWATKIDGTVDGEEYSAKYYADMAATSAGNMADRDLGNLTTSGEAKFAAKQDVITDLADIRAGVAKGETAVQPADLATVATTGAYADLSGKPTNVSTFANDAGYLTAHQDISGKADNNAVVHLTGNEIINGEKIFTSEIKRTAALSADEHWLARIYDSNGKGSAGAVSYYAGNSIYNRIMSNNTTAGGYAYLDVQARDDGGSIFTIYGANGITDVNYSILATLSKSLGQNGYVQLSNGLIIQWGKASNTSNNNITVNFPKAFTSTNYSINAMRTNQPSGYSYDGITGVSSRTTTFCILYSHYGSSEYDWIAIGY